MNYSFSIIIPVYKEAEFIQETLSQLLVSTQHGLIDIIVVDGDQSGGTINTITHLDIKKTIASKGRGNQMNKGASLARGDILIFLHADTFLPENALKEIQSAFNKTRIVGGAFELGINSPQKHYRYIEAAVKLRTHLTRIPYGDQAIFMKKDCFIKLGGFPQVPIMEDIGLMQQVRRKGEKIAILPLKVKTSARRWENEGVVYCTLRNWALMLFYYMGVPPNRLARFYYRQTDRSYLK
jgi:rSAM/selenodomain-associated transferase 2